MDGLPNPLLGCREQHFGKSEISQEENSVNQKLFWCAVNWQNATVGKQRQAISK
jgi:hypothetical protein